MSTRTDEPLSGQQLQAIAKQASAALQKTVNEMNLRRWCLEMSIQACHGHGPDEVVQLAKDIHGWVNAPAQEVSVSIEADLPLGTPHPV